MNDSGTLNLCSEVVCGPDGRKKKAIRKCPIKIQPFQPKPVVCGKEGRCYALQHAINCGGIETALLFNIATAKSRTGIGVGVAQDKTHPKKKTLFFFTYCPWCGNKIFEDKL